VKRRIDEMAQNGKDMLHHSACFALQWDESHDTSSDARLVAFVRYEHKNKVCGDLFFHGSLPVHTTAEALFKVVITANNLQCGKCVSAQMVLRQCREYIKVRSHAPLVKWAHCCIGREAPDACRMPSKMKTVLDEAVKMANFIEARPTIFCTS
jgi:hypothetical protein